MPAPGVKARVDRFWRSVKRLQKISSTSLEQFVGDEDLVDAGERNLQLAIETTIDVGEALLAYMGWRTPRSYREIGVILLENRVIDGALSEKFSEAVSIRNILVHNYTHLAPEELQNRIKGFIEPLTKIMCSLLNYLEEKKIDP